MDTISYLLELIETRKIVGITDLGTLYIKKTPGRYDADAHAFLPPKHEIAFTSEIKEADELKNFISEKRNVPTASAAHDIAEFVTNIKTQLADHQFADLSPLGVFKVINDQIEFESSKKFQIGSDFYGLPKIPVPVDSPVEKLHSTPEAIPIPDETREATHTTPPPLPDPVWRPTVNDRYEYEAGDDDEDETSGRGKRIFFKTLIVLFVIAIAGAIVYFFYPDLLNNLLQKHPDQQIESASVIDLDTNSTQQVDSTFADTVKKPIQLTEIQDTVTTTQTTYEVIGSAMKGRKKVEQVIGNFARRGIKAKAIDGLPGRLIKVSLGTFTDYNLAKKFQDSLKIKLKNPEIYIQTIKPKN
ncbi:HU domain-containing protein [Pedobacter insulae]|uniref:CCDC81-like prokaryotic HU domain-containing protein n=1 Tax=Pedobacter insulae TaxID=414048 RepID=A0A1I2U7G7_9SPHI|nr:hypothetical protein [Pedobacter insulae]SFG73105.1 hypothetical protein SAMN04489864_10214 [Pedobacter insulae]